MLVSGVLTTRSLSAVAFEPQPNEEHPGGSIAIGVLLFGAEVKTRFARVLANVSGGCVTEALPVRHNGSGDRGRCRRLARTRRRGGTGPASRSE